MFVTQNITYNNRHCFILILVPNVLYKNNKQQQKLNIPIKSFAIFVYFFKLNVLKSSKKKSLITLHLCHCWRLQFVTIESFCVMNKNLFREYSSVIRSNAFISHLKSRVITLLESEKEFHFSDRYQHTGMFEQIRREEMRHTHIPVPHPFTPTVKHPPSSKRQREHQKVWSQRNR